MLKIIFLLYLIFTFPLAAETEWDDVPYASQGRIRPASLFPAKGLERLTSPDFKVLPSKLHEGIWISLAEVRDNPRNVTLYSNETYQDLQTLYLQTLEHPELQSNIARILASSYLPLAGTVMQEAYEKELLYPTQDQLKVEAIYMRIPLIPIALALYVSASILLFISPSAWGLLFMGAAFALHTLILALRCYILARPPVSNMFETVIYVPWVAVLIGLILNTIRNRRELLAGAGIVASTLLILLQITKMNSSMENVQAVLDSQYWLIVHVLLVVGSYGAFALAGILGHFYLIKNRNNRGDDPQLAASILQTLYIGTGMLIAGTLLGGVWAAQSWGRFWDWDPKESWAFISICIYLIGIHLYRFGKVGPFGLACGSIIGLQAIAFTWYGVNYILGTGLHSYGFGNGGEPYFYLYLLSETFFLGYFFSSRRSLLRNC